MSKRIIKEITEYKKEMKKRKKDTSNMFLVLNENIFKKKKFTFLGFSVIYSNNIGVPYYFIEFKSKKLSYNFIRRLERNANYKSR